MRAARFYAPHDVRVEDIDDPSPRAGEIKLRVAANGLCGSDLHEFFAGQMMTPVEPHPETGVQVPVVLGHEFSGTVIELGDGVESVQVGDRVAVRPTIACGHCHSCLAGCSNICQRIAFHGLSAETGGLSTFSVVAADAAHVLPATVSLEAGALVEPMAVAYHAVHLAGLTAGASAMVVGLGPIGIGVWFALRAAGIGPIVLCDPSATRRDAATHLGAECVVDPTVGDPEKTAREVTAGRGVDAVFDAAGVGQAVTQGLAALAPRGKLVVVGLHLSSVQIMPTDLVLNETQVLGSGTYCDEDFDAVISGMEQGHYPLDGWVTHTPLDNIVDALEQLRDGQRIKVLIDLDDSDANR